MNKTKKCNKCGHELHILEFNKNENICKLCSGLTKTKTRIKKQEEKARK